ncbi:MAG: hypothetical protein RBU29_02820 [bacterium]|nr:hypothetical protein [bacterium]
MKKQFSFLFSVCILCLSQSGLAYEWKTDLDQALSDGQKNGKPVMAYFYYQAHLAADMKVWDHPYVTQYDGKFIPVMLDVDGTAEQIKKYGVLTFPSILFFDTKGRELLFLRYEEDKLLRSAVALRMKKALENMEEFSLLESQFETLKTNPRMVLKYATGLRDRAKYTEAETYFKQLFSNQTLPADLKAQVTEDYAHMILFNASRAFFKDKFEDTITWLQKFKANCKNTNFDMQVDLMLGMALIEAGSQDQGRQILNEIIKKDKDGDFGSKAKLFLDEKKGGKRR